MALDPVPTYPGNYDANEANNTPSGSDTRREGDDQIRRIKASEKSTWTNVTGAVTATHEQLNLLSATDTAQALIQFESGVTKALFYNDVAPNGWAIDAVPDDTMVRITKGLAGGGVQGGTITGTHAFSATFTTLAEGASPGVGNHTLVEAEIPQHNHGGGSHSHLINHGGLATTTINSGNAFANTTQTGGFYASPTKTATSGGYIDSTSNINSYGGLAPAHAHTLDQDARASACIICTKA